MTTKIESRVSEYIFDEEMRPFSAKASLKKFGDNNMSDLDFIRKHDECNLILMIGPASLGKSKLAKHRYPDAYYTTLRGCIDDYQKHETVVIDEFLPGRHSIQDFLVFVEKHKLRGEIKDANNGVYPGSIVIISNSKPDTWFPTANTDDWNTFKEKVTTVVEFHDQNTWREYSGVNYFQLIQFLDHEANTNKTLSE